MSRELDTTFSASQTLYGEWSPWALCKCDGVTSGLRHHSRCSGSAGCPSRTLSTWGPSNDEGTADRSVNPGGTKTRRCCGHRDHEQVQIHLFPRHILSRSAPLPGTATPSGDIADGLMVFVHEEYNDEWRKSARSFSL